MPASYKAATRVVRLGELISLLLMACRFTGVYVEHSVVIWVAFCSTTRIRVFFSKQVRETPPRRLPFEFESILKGVVGIVVVQCSTFSIVLKRYHCLWKTSSTSLNFDWFKSRL